MKSNKPAKNRNLPFLFLLVLGGVFMANAQVEVPFTPRLNDGGNSYINIKGDYTFLANGILNRVNSSNTANDPYNGSSNNNGFHRDYIDIDGDPSTFSSSSSTLTVPTCSQIYYAGLYWSGNYQQEVLNNTEIASLPNQDTQRLDFTAIKFKVPGGSYIDLVADNNADPVGQEDDIIYDNVNFKDSPYTCYKNVTDQLRALADPAGEYFVANVRGTRGKSVGGAAGWTLVVVYENPTLTGKYISIFDGYAGVRGSTDADIVVSGFNTIPVGPVNAKLGASVVEGDRGITGDSFQIQTPLNPGFSNLSNSSNPSNNFFNSNITIDGANVATRNIASTNTLGYDADIFEISNPSNSVIENSETQATLRLHTEGDAFGAFLVTFGVEIIEPTIVLEKKVENIAGDDITGQGVNLGQVLDYVLSFQNIGNDDGTNYTIRDVLPSNVTLDESSFTLPTGVTYTFDVATQTVVFTIPDNLINEGDPIAEIRMRVQVAQNCFDFVDACTDRIENIAYSTYEGVINDNVISDDPSVSDFDDCGFTTPGATNFLLDDLENCDFSRTVQLCGNNVLLEAGDNFDDYIWYKDENGDGLIDAGDTLMNDGNPDNDLSTLSVDEVGVYIVDKIVADPCKGFQEIITVEFFGVTQTNPISALINDPTNSVEGEVVICPNDGEELPKIFLCGLNDTELIQINIPDADSINWEQLNEGSCTASIEDCANKNSSCTWNNVGTGSNFLASDAGQYRVVINYQNGCATRFYFNIFKNPLNPQYNATDLICTTPGNITVTNMPADYEYQLLDATNGSILVPYSSNNGPSFTLTSNGAYTVEMRQQGVVDGCIFRLENIGILTRDFQVDITTKDTDCTGLGEISISVLDVEPQYYYEISQGGTVVDTFGPSDDNNYTFENLNPGVYDVLATTDDGCSHTEQVTINDLTDLDLEARISQHISCKEGNILMDSNGGQTPHTYAIWSYIDEGGTTVISYPTVNDIPASEYQTSNIFDILDPGDYTFVVIDKNNCTAISNTVTIVLVPAVEYTTAIADENCFGAADGSITYNITTSNGYNVDYTLTYPDGSTVINSSGSFTGLPQGDYTVTLTQSKGGASCDYIENFTIGGPVNGVSATAVIIQDYTCSQNGTIEAQNVSGGTAPYEYSIDGVNFVSGAGAETFSNLTYGTYAITVRDANGCTFVTNQQTLDPLNGPSDLTFAATTPNCPALTSDVTVSIVDGNPLFTFEIIAPAASAVNNGNNATFVGLTPDTYTFRVTDDKDCTYEESYTIDPVVPIDVVGQLVNNITCFTDTDGEILFTVSGFNTSYDYSVTGPSNFNGTGETGTTIPLNNLDDGTYTITVTDTDTNCTDIASVTVEAPPAALTMNASETQPTCVSDGNVVLTAADGWGGYNFSLTYPDGTTTVTNTTGSFANLTQPGTYNASVTDVNGCVVPTTFVLNAAIAPVLEIVPNDICFDNTVGLVLTANVISGGDGNYEYSLNGGIYDTANTFSGLAPGTYTIAVRDGKNCTDTETITINPEVTVTASAGNIDACSTDTDITITAAGGDGSFVYAVVGNGVAPVPGDFNATNPITVTGAGNYDVYVRDKNGGVDFCEASYDITILQDAPLSISIINTPILCSGEAQATLTVTASGGEAPFEYSIDNGTNYQTSNTFVNRPAGSYTIRVRDVNNCDISQIYSITEPFTLSASVGVTELVECNPSVGAEVRITNAQGGTAPYTYSFDGGSNYGASAIGFLLPGTHTVLVRDANMCTFPMTVTVDPEPTPPNVITSVVYECDGEGTITITPDSPTYDYTYEINGTPNTPATSNIFSDVAVGSHSITVNYTSNIPPTPSNLLLEDFGTGPNTSIPEVDPAYCYEPQDGSTSACEPGVPVRINDGEYSVTQVITSPFGSWLSPNDHSGQPTGRFLAMNVGGVVGPNGIIYAKRNIEVLPNRDITISLWAFNLLRTGTGGADPDINIQLVDGGGTEIASTTTGNVPKNTGANDWQNYTVALNPGANTNLDIVIRTNSAVTGGNDIAIDDIEAFQIPGVCASSVSVNVQVEGGNAFDASITNFTNISCNGVSDGTITFEVENFDTVNGFEYAVNGGTFSAPQMVSPVTVNGLGAGPNTITVRDVLDNTCSIPLSENLSEPTAILATASITEQFTCNNTGATITASATGGTPTYEYQLEDNALGIITPYQTSAIFTNLVAGDYIVRARDTNLCSDPIDAPITVVAPSNPTFTATPTACYSGSNDGSIQVDVTSVPGNGGFQFSINSGPWMTPTPTTATTYTFQNLANGSYTIDVKDGFGCAGIQQNVPINAQLTANAVLNTDLTCLSPAMVTITATGGSGSYSYEWSNDAGTNYFTTNFTGNVFNTSTDATYIFRVTDTTAPAACTVVTNAVTITPADTPIITTVTPTNILCNGDSSGALDVVIDTSVGLPPYTIEVVETISAINYGTQTTGLPAGDYEVTITDDKGCPSALFSVSITQPNAIVPNITSTNLTCTLTVNELGTITVDASDGTPTYIYRVFNNDFSFSQTYDTSLGTNDHTFTGLDFGDYTVSITDANGCENISSVTITTGPDVLVTTQGTAGCTPGSGEMVVQAQASNGTLGTGTFYFAIYPAPTFNAADPAWFAEDASPPALANSKLFTGLTPGVTYTFIVYDTDTNCEYIQEAIVPVLSSSTLNSTIDATTDVTCMGDADGTVNFTVSGYGATDVGYELFVATTNITTGASGNISGAVGGPESDTLSGIPPGTFYILFTEVGGPNAGCVVASDPFVIQQAPSLLTVTAASPTNDNCNLNVGVITATAQFGISPYEFQYLLSTDPAPTAGSAGWTSNTFANVESGNYIVYVKDANNCIQNDAITVALDASPEISLSIVNECVAEGSFEVLVTLNVAGSAPYQLSVNGSAFQNITFNVSGEYTVSGLSSGLAQTIAIRDLNGCGETDPFNIQPPLQFTVLQTVLLDCEPGAAANAEITIEVTSGSGNYEFAIDGPGAVDQSRTALTSNPFIWNGASAAGSYNVSIYDIVTMPPNCTKSIIVDIPNAVVPDFTETHVDVSCNGAADGSITLNETDNGINPLTYTLTPMPIGVVLNGNTFENVPPGTYSVRGTGTNDCFTDIFSIDINEPNVIVVPAPTVVEFGCTAGNNPNNATITINNPITGGSNNYVRYEFINDDDPSTVAIGDPIVVQNGTNTTYIETNTLGGSYTINVYDDKGCLGTTTATILPYDELMTAVAAITNPIGCNPGTDGEITITVTSTDNDTSKFEYSIDNGASYQASNVFTGLGIATHNFLIRHVDTGCIITASETITDPNTFTIDVNKLSDVVCHGTTTGQVTFELLDATYPGGFDWEIFDTNGTPVNLADDISIATGSEATNGPTTVINLAAGSYYVEISQNNHPECVNTEAFSINGPTAAITGDTQVTPVTCVLNDGVIEIIDVVGGWGGYTYFVDLASNPAPTFPASYQTSPTFSGLAGGLAPGTDYQVWVADQDGCEIQLPNVTLVDPTAITATLQINQENCTDLQGEMEVVGTAGGQNGNYTYQLIKDGADFGAPQNTTVFPGLGAGSYEVRINDQWSCTTTIGPEVLYEEMNLGTTVVKPIDCTPTPGGEITITVNGGSSNLDYTVTYPDGFTTVSNTDGIFTGLTQPGTYSFVISDLDTANPVCTKTITEELDAPAPVTFDVHTIVDVSCNGLSDGSITINLMPTSAGVNDNPIYTYNLYDAGVLFAGPQTDPTFSGLAAGSYEVEAISDRGCSLREVVIVEEPTALLIDAAATAFNCNPNNSVNTATITVTILDGASTPGVLSGTGPYLYSIDNVNFQTSNTFEIIDTGSPQNITAYVTDGNSCPETFPLPTLQPLNIFTATVSLDAAITCPGSEEVTITVVDNGNPANTYTYELLPLGNPNGMLTGTPTNTTAEFDLTAVGSYTFRVTDTATGCYVDTAPYEIMPYDLIDVVATATTPVTCFGDTDGALEITVTGYSSDYSYEVFNVAGVSTGVSGNANASVNPVSITGLSGGNYYVRVTETGPTSTLCFDDSNIITIISPDTALSAIVNPIANVTCTNDQGEILVDPSGGYPPYDIVLTNTVTTQVYTATDVLSNLFTGLSAGSYTIAVTDDGGCVYNDTETLVQPTPISAGISPDVILSCFGDTDATLSAINVTGGQGPGNYQYQLNYYDAAGVVILFTSGPQTSDTFNNLGSGIYSITISDGWNCGVETAEKRTVSEPNEVSSTLIQTSPLTCTTDATLLLTASGGNGAPYQFSTDNITFTAMSGGNTHTFNIAAGNEGIYQYYVVDVLGCEAIISNQISVDEVPPLLIDVDESAAIINCTGEATATIIANASGGLGNYSYELFGDAALTNLLAGPQASAEFNTLIAGSYYVRVTSVDCIEVSNEVVISNPIPLQIDRQEFTDITCAGQDNGTITVEVSGGTGTILYAITPNLNRFDPENVFTNLAPGVYDIIAQDENGCFIPFQFTISEPAPIDAAYTALPEVCFGSEDGSIDVTISGGTGPYSTSLNSNNDADFVQDRTSFTDLAAGTYVVFIKDAQDCETNLIVEIEPGVNLNATVVPVYECTGDTPNNYVNITLEDDSVLGSIMYALDSTDPADMQLNPDFRDSAPGAHYIAISHANGCVFTVDFEIEAFEPLTLSLEQNNINEITAIAAGGLQDYTFYFGDADNGTDNTFIINRTDTYTVTLVDGNGCEAVGEIFMEFIDIEIPNFFTPDGDGLNDFWVPKNLEAFPEILTIIFDRYGREVYRMGINDPGWEGIYHNSELPTGDYWYIIKLRGEIDDREFVGHFTLYR